MAINLEGTFLGCRAAVAAMKGGKGGSIVNIASTLGVRAGALFPAYAASKGGVRLLTRAVALHCAEQGYDIRVNAVLPGAIHTEMVEGYVAAGIAAGASREAVLEGFASAHPLRRLGRPAEAAEAIVFLASDEVQLHHRRRHCGRRRLSRLIGEQGKGSSPWPRRKPRWFSLPWRRSTPSIPPS